MAFDDVTFVDTWADPPVPVNTSEAAHDKLLLREKVNFMEVLVGGDSSNGVPQVLL